MGRDFSNVGWDGTGRKIEWDGMGWDEIFSNVGWDGTKFFERGMGWDEK